MKISELTVMEFPNFLRASYRPEITLRLTIEEDLSEFKDYVLEQDYLQHHIEEGENKDDFYYPDGYVLYVNYELAEDGSIYKPKWRSLSAEIYYVGDHEFVPCRLASKEELKMIKNYIKEHHEKLKQLVIMKNFDNARFTKMMDTPYPIK